MLKRCQLSMCLTSRSPLAQAFPLLNRFRVEGPVTLGPQTLTVAVGGGGGSNVWRLEFRCALESRVAHLAVPPCPFRWRRVDAIWVWFCRAAGDRDELMAWSRTLSECDSLSQRNLLQARQQPALPHPSCVHSH